MTSITAKLKLILPYVVAIVIAVAPLVLGKLVLRGHARSFAATEVEFVAQRYLGRAERIVSEAIGVLRDLDRAGHRGCTDVDRVDFAERVSRSEFIRRIGIVDRNGFSMCLEPPPPGRPAALLGAAEDDNRQVTIVVRPLPAAMDGAMSAVTVGWRGTGGTRLVAEISASALKVDAGPSFTREQQRVEVTVDGGRPWFRVGPAERRGDGMVSVADRSDIFPISVHVEVPAANFAEVVRPLDVTLGVGSTAASLVLFGIVVWLTWRPNATVDDEFTVALQNNEFVPYYQPVMNIETGQIEGCELLVRWIRPDGTVVSPGRFMPYAETTGHGFEITRALMRQSVKDLGPLYSKNRDLKLSINLFAGHFDDLQVVNDISSTFGNGPIEFSQLVFEVTERYPLRDIDMARNVISELHTLGCRVALDDTGTGHGGLAYLQQLGIDIIKIDKMFIDAMGRDLGASTIIDVLVELASSLGMGIVAEGVEHEEQIERLREKGVTAAQGYVFAPPLPAKLFLELAGALVVDHDDEMIEKAAA